MLFHSPHNLPFFEAFFLYLLCVFKVFFSPPPSCKSKFKKPLRFPVQKRRYRELCCRALAKRAVKKRRPSFHQLLLPDCLEVLPPSQAHWEDSSFA